MVIDSFSQKYEAEHFISYLRSDFVRFLVSIKKITQDITKDTWCLVPDISIVESLSVDDLYVFFDLDEQEINHIKNKVLIWKQ